MSALWFQCTTPISYPFSPSSKTRCAFELYACRCCLVLYQDEGCDCLGCFISRPETRGPTVLVMACHVMACHVSEPSAALGSSDTSKYMRLSALELVLISKYFSTLYRVPLYRVVVLIYWVANSRIEVSSVTCWIWQFWIAYSRWAGKTTSGTSPKGDTC
ncbi:hypothetical protein L228DRAFT_30015 [Xylona heveae TC161]|uniref:Uncharacterized protein n=1 Tax=Xylona heveae (strain CBS 132557 / TC161) TaxID=1328760 RepID=A0A165A1F1_XYLHT|nr:hypothetical protein L228DRAFT_30015 [Xylona heveae TC161]KZF19820.1 hypothetical protein L228DRAFT_30015 [Xylona heveae TC161]